MSPQIFLATYFVGNGETGVFLAVSEDGYEFKPLREPNVPVMKPIPGTLTRDPCLLMGEDGVWHMVWTTGWWTKTIGVGRSRDLKTWEQQAVPVMGEFHGTVNAWAPEITFDPASGRYLIYWSSTVPSLYPETARKDGDLAEGGVPLNHRFYATATKDFKSFAPSFLLWNPGFNCIDATLVPHEGKWLMFGKDETKAPSASKFLFVAHSGTATGPFRMISPRITGDYWAEGPTVVKVGESFRVYFDRYMENGWGAVESEDLHRWRDVSDRIKMPRGARHGTILRVDRSVVDGLR